MKPRLVVARLAAVACLAAGSGCASSSPTGTSVSRATGVGQAPPVSAGHHRDRHRVVVHHQHAVRRRRHPGGVPAVDMPNRALTPGAAFTTSAARICVAGYSASVRNVPAAENAAVYARYGIPHVPYRHEVDHLVSLEIGGSNAIINLWPEPYAGRWGARTKDVLENTLHDLVCSGALNLARAQRLEARNWVAAYQRYVSHTPPPASTTSSGAAGGSTSGGGSSIGGYYASRYGSASTIYCADDPEWGSLSKTYLIHFHTWAQAIKRFPDYHLHQPC